MKSPTHDPLAEALEAWSVPELDATFAGRVHARAQAYLAAATPPPLTAARLRLTLAGALVPGLLVSAATEQVTDAVTTIHEVYGSRSPR